MPENSNNKSIWLLLVWVILAFILTVSCAIKSDIHNIAYVLLLFFFIFVLLGVFFLSFIENNSNDDVPISFTLYDPDNKNTDSVSGSLQQVFPAHKGITEEYFGLCNHQSKKMFNYLETLNDDLPLIEFIKGIKGLESVDALEDYSADINKRLFVLFIYDLVKVYKQLGHNFQTQSKEMLPLGLLLLQVMSKGTEITYNHIDVFYNKMMDSVTSFLKFIETAEAPDVTDKYAFYLPLIFNLYGESDRIHSYMVILYRFASLVAKADGVVNKKESEYLAGLMANNKIQITGESIDPPKTMSNPDPIKELNNLIGITSVKDEVKKLCNYIKVQQMRQDKVLKQSPMSYHCVFTGNPGTGKTTVARIIAQIYRDLGVLKKGHLIETDRSGLVAEYVGQTAVKTNKIIDSALDGVLFIDEAYSLAGCGNNDYGIEAISTLLKRMEDDRERLVVILAGYSEEMKKFIDSNPGLQSRFNRYIHFEDYSAEQLVEIYKINVNNNDYYLSQEAEDDLHIVIEKAIAGKDKNFGNARFVRNLFEKTLENQATRLASHGTITKELLQEIQLADIPK